MTFMVKTTGADLDKAMNLKALINLKSTNRDAHYTHHIYFKGA